MLNFEININKIESLYKNQVKNDENFIINYARRLNYFGNIVLSNFTSYQRLKEICSVAECNLMMNSPKFETIKSVLQMGVKKIIIPEKDVIDIGQRISKTIIIAKITLQKKILLDNNLINLKDGLKAIFDRVNPYCSELLIDYDEDLDINESTVLTVLDSLSDFNNYPLIFLDSDNKLTKILEKKGANPLISSKDLYEEKELIRTLTSVINFKKQEGLVPTIVQDEHNQILMLAFSSQESLKQALVQKKGIYYSRSRNSIWIKGETSGNYQSLCKARYDCDQDTLLFIVRQEGVACHLQRYSCFGNKTFKLSDLYEIIQDRILNPAANSYTSKISIDERLIIEKIREESNEVINYTNEENLVWEIADLLYFIMVLMAKKEIKLQDILNELWSRRNYGN
ncbi:MAG: bifunctional phosphoribosyl-AMP cyclohydrolase/phosphoribosyl-ATP diphosphatase HisIE [Candidatus Lokiarchaeota archaeon]|nr:bifunctional phosphoribosyl-AMP cyclohydrolase/phosphoribosyl-ATP diphosphatase HisIE [Candidatus Lokiarchaeota archaeon]